MHQAARLTPAEISFRTIQIDAQRTALSLPSFAQISRRQHRNWPVATQAQARGLLRQTAQECVAALATASARRIELWPQGSALRSTWAEELLYADARALERAGFDAAAFAAGGGDLLGFGRSLTRRGGESQPISYLAEHYPEDGALAWWTFFIAVEARFVLTLDAVYPFGLPAPAALARLRELRRRWLFVAPRHAAGAGRGGARRCASRRATHGSAGEAGKAGL